MQKADHTSERVALDDVAIESERRDRAAETGGQWETRERSDSRGRDSRDRRAEGNKREVES